MALQQSMGGCKKMPKPGSSHACPCCDSGCLTVHHLQCNLGGHPRWHNNLVGIGVHSGAEGWHVLMIPAAEQLVCGPHKVGSLSSSMQW